MKKKKNMLFPIAPHIWPSDIHHTGDRQHPQHGFWSTVPAGRGRRSLCSDGDRGPLPNRRMKRSRRQLYPRGFLAHQFNIG